MENKYDFSGWATRNDLLCNDGRTIRKDAFKHNDGQKVPLVWNHDRDTPDNVLGHALLENREEGVYAYGIFNDSDSGKQAKELVRHGDVRSLSIYANKLRQNGGDVLHGDIKELSLVLAGANPGAFIDSVMIHGEESEDCLIIGYDENIMLYHSEEPEQKEEIEHKEDKKEEPKKMAEVENKDKTIQDVIDSMTEEQKTAMYAVIAEIVDDEDEGGDDVKHNIFTNDEVEMDNVLSHDDIQTIIKDGKRLGSLRESFLEHAGDDAALEYAPKGQTYGINGTDFLFPDAHNLNTTPEFIKRDTGWVSKVMNGTHHTPFSRIKSMFADITEDEARAKGYIKGKLKKEEVFSLLKRSTTPTTVYKKQKMDRDDVIDITDMDVIAWLKSEMRLMLDEEIARAILIGDGRLASSDDKINETHIRPIWKDEDLFTIKTKVKVKADADESARAKSFIDQCVRAKKNYKGSGNTTCFMTEDLLTDCLLLEDGIGHKLYKSVAEVATAIRCKEIVTVPVMENVKDGDGNPVDLAAIIVNLSDYTVGADKGGSINMFEDFDIDYNQQKYLIETRCSGALTKPFSAIAVEFETVA